jgi:hypothetical protein
LSIVSSGGGGAGTGVDGSGGGVLTATGEFVCDCGTCEEDAVAFVCGCGISVISCVELLLTESLSFVGICGGILGMTSLGGVVVGALVAA